jgi:hypothetical protein
VRTSDACVELGSQQLLEERAEQREADDLAETAHEVDEAIGGCEQKSTEGLLCL